MKILQQLIFCLLVVSLLVACENPSADTPTEDQPTTTPTKEPTPVPVDLSQETVSFKALSQGENEQGVPQARLYLYTSVTTDSLFLTDDITGTMVEKSAYPSFGIPENAVLGIESYYAGGGNYYYAETKDNVLTVYKGGVSEPQPEVELPDPASSYKPFKKFIFYQDKVIEEDL